MKVLVLAEDPQIVHALSTYFEDRGRNYLVCSIADLSAQANLGAFFRAQSVSLVLNTASMSLLEERPDSELVAGVKELAEICHSLGIMLVQLSSSLVFDGLDGGRHREGDEVVPASRVGALHWQMEQAVRSTCAQHIILRGMPLFSAEPGNLLTVLIDRFQAGGVIEASTTGKAAPVHCDDLARVLSGMIDQLSCGADVWGTYHYGASDPVSYYQFSETVLAVVAQYIDATSIDLQSIECSHTVWPQPLLNCDKLLTTFGIKQLPWRSSIAGAVKQVLNPEEEASE